jgi:hypothetical protein
MKGTSLTPSCVRAPEKLTESVIVWATGIFELGCSKILPYRIADITDLHTGGTGHEGCISSHVLGLSTASSIAIPASTEHDIGWVLLYPPESMRSLLKSSGAQAQRLLNHAGYADGFYCSQEWDPSLRRIFYVESSLKGPPMSN